MSELDFWSWIQKNQIIVGWVGGALSTSIIPLITWKLKKRRFIKSFDTELGYLQTLASMFWLELLKSQVPLTDKQLFDISESVSTCVSSPESELLRLRITDELAVDESVRRQRFGQSNVGPERTKAVPFFNASFLESNTESWPLLTDQDQIVAVRVLRTIHLINKKVEDFDHWHRMTFSISNENYSNAVVNSKSSLNAITSACEILAKTIHSRNRAQVRLFPRRLIGSIGIVKKIARRFSVLTSINSSRN